MTKIYTRFVLGLVLACLSCSTVLGQETALHGRLEERDGQRILFLWGTPYERGYAEGFLQAEAIHECFVGYFLSEKLLPSPKLWDLMVLPLVKSRVTVRKRTADRTRGIIAGMNARLPEEERVIQKLGRALVSEDLYAAIAAVDWIGQFCSSFVAYRTAISEGSGPLVGRNLDYSSSKETVRNTLVKVEAADPETGTLAWISFGWPGMPGCITGISEARVSVAIHDVPAKAPTEGRLTPRLDALGELIETLKPGPNLGDEAAKILGRHQFAYGANVMLGWHLEESPGVRGAVLEVDTNGAITSGVSVRSNPDTDFVICTNHHRQRKESTNCDRYEALEKGCELAAGLDADPLDFDNAWRLVSKASVGMTIYRNLFDLESGRIRFQRRQKPFGRWGPVLEYDLEDLLSECSDSPH